jgi:hypothetical protein
MVLKGYLLLKNMKPAERKTVNRRVVFFAGKAAPACMLFAFPLSILILDASNCQITSQSWFVDRILYFPELLLIVHLIDHSPYN